MTYKEQKPKVVTPQQMIEYMVEALNNAVKYYPEEEQEAAKAKVLDAFNAAMFKGLIGDAVVIPYRPTDLKGLKVRHECVVCRATGVTGYVCPRYDCPTKVSCS